MKIECTEHVLRYREVARLVWNLGIWASPPNRDYAAIDLYNEAMLRLFVAIVLVPLGYQAEFEDKNYPGKSIELRVEIKEPPAELFVNKNLPTGYRVWGEPTLLAESGDQQLRFMAFFDWRQLGPIDLRLIEVLIEKCDKRPEIVGHHALIELAACTMFLIVDK
jgi:hypothetical protein